MVKKYTPTSKEKYMSDKQKIYFKKRLVDWKNEIMEINSKGLYLNNVDNEISSLEKILEINFFFLINFSILEDSTISIPTPVIFILTIYKYV